MKMTVIWALAASHVFAAAAIDDAPDPDFAALRARQTPTPPFVIPTHTSQCNDAYNALASAMPTMGPHLESMFSTMEQSTLPTRGLCDPQTTSGWKDASPEHSSVYAAYNSVLSNWLFVSGGQSLVDAISTVCMANSDPYSTAAAISSIRADISKSCAAERAAITTGTTTSSGETAVGSPTQTTEGSGAAGRKMGWNLGWAGVGLTALAMNGF